MCEDFVVRCNGGAHVKGSLRRTIATEAATTPNLKNGKVKTQKSLHHRKFINDKGIYTYHN